MGAGVGAVALAAFAGAAAGQDRGGEMRIASMVPEHALVAGEIFDLSAVRGALEGTRVGELLASAEMRPAIDEALSDLFEVLDENLEPLGLERADLEWPEGALSFAVFTEEPLASFEPEALEKQPPVVLLTAELGGAAAFYADLLERVTEQGLDDRTIELDEEEHNGVTIVTVGLVREGAEGFEDALDGFDGFGGPGGVGLDDVVGPPGELDEFHYALADGTLVFCTSLDGVRNAIDGMGGELDGALSSADVLAEARSFAGMPGGGGHGFAFVNLDALSVAAENGAGLPGGAATALAVVSGLGVREASSAGVSFGVGSNGFELVFAGGLLLDGFEGLWGLLPADPGPWRLPPGATAEAVSVQRFAVEFDRVLPLAGEVINGLPQEQREMAAGQFALAGGVLTPILNALTGEVEVVSTLERPFGPSSNKTTVALPSTDVQTVGGIIEGVGGNFGLLGRDVAGGRLFADQNGFVPFAAGVGGGRLFVGQSESIESALRLSAAGEGGGLAETDRFQRAARLVPPRAFSAGWTRNDIGIEFAIWQAENAELILKEQMRQFNPEMTDEEFRDFGFEVPDTPAFVQKLPDASFIGRHVGDSLTFAVREDEGIRFRTILLTPED